nr:hypothetical protein GCM10020093_076690 [Planobispora longispora]
MSRVLVVDNHDSFVHTIVQYLRELGAECDVRPRDAVAVEDAAGFDGVLVSPGPGTPEEAGVSVPSSATASAAACRCSASASGTRRSRWPTARP